MLGIPDDLTGSRNHDQVELFHLEGPEQCARAARHDDGLGEGPATDDFEFDGANESCLDFTTVGRGEGTTVRNGYSEELGNLFRDAELDGSRVGKSINLD